MSEAKQAPPTMKDRLTTDQEKADFAAKRQHVGFAVDTDLGMRFGPNSEFTLMFNVQPGHAEQLREDIGKFGEAVKGSRVPFLVGLHDSRLCLFDDDTRLLFSTTFDGDINVYVDDAIHGLGDILHLWLRHLDGYPGTMDAYPDPKDFDAFKKWFMSHFHKSSAYTRIYPRPLQEILKGLAVNEAFQQVLDDPASHAALQEPAFKPLLDLAAY